MNSLDESILELFAEIDGKESISLPPTPVWYNIVEVRGLSDRSSNTVSRRMNKLSKAGLLNKVDEDRGYYKITQLGIDFLEDELTEEQHDHLRSAFSKE